MEFAPIVLFVYNRPKHTKLVLDALALNFGAKDSVLFIYADGPKPGITAEQQQLMDETRILVQSETRFKKTTVIVRNVNYGLFRNVSEGVSEVLGLYGKVIVLEDDTLPAPGFLKFCNDGLIMYQNSPNVYSVNGYQHPINTNRFETILLPFTNVWGWATWSEKWGLLDPSPVELELMRNNNFVKSRFNLADYDFVHMFENKKSWAIKWYFKVFSYNGLNVFPTQSLVVNIGFDGSGENSGLDYQMPYLFKGEIEVNYTERIDIPFYGKVLSFFDKSKKNERSKRNLLFNLIVKVAKVLLKVP